mmetsp:Transcript_78689/g.218560  ORF Transcript_78689/g.218560 Transcript_78689/m.218560 type:complete len:231 (+) Transcript_78689:604-1296(+)
MEKAKIILRSLSFLPSTNLSIMSGAIVRLHRASIPALCTSSLSEKRRSRQWLQPSACNALDRSSSLAERRFVSAIAPSNCNSSCLCSMSWTSGRTASSCSLYCNNVGLVTMRICARACLAASRDRSSSRSTRFNSARIPPLVATMRRCPWVAHRNFNAKAAKFFARTEPLVTHLAKLETTRDVWTLEFTCAAPALPLWSAHHALIWSASSTLPASTSPFRSGRDSAGIFS